MSEHKTFVNPGVPVPDEALEGISGGVLIGPVNDQAMGNSNMEFPRRPNAGAPIAGAMQNRLEHDSTGSASEAIIKDEYLIRR